MLEQNGSQINGTDASNLENTLMSFSEEKLAAVGELLKIFELDLAGMDDKLTTDGSMTLREILVLKWYRALPEAIRGDFTEGMRKYQLTWNEAK